MKSKENIYVGPGIDKWDIPEKKELSTAENGKPDGTVERSWGNWESTIRAIWVSILALRSAGFFYLGPVSKHL